jgi:beta-lactamase regulating signal transducer with metallopeptidase domain
MNILSHIQITDFCTAALQFGADAALKSFILFLIGGAAVLILRHVSAATRHLILFYVLVGALLLPVLSLVLPSWPVWTFNLPGPTHKVSADPSKATMFVVRSLPVFRVNSAELFPPTQQLKSSNARVPTDDKLQMSETLVLVWISGFIICLSPLFGGMLSLFVLRRSSTQLSSGRAHEALQQAAVIMAFPGRIRLFESPKRSIPMTWGLLHPIIIIPKAAEEWSMDRLRLVFLHELAHLKRHDFLRKLFGHFTCSLYWFNPLAWFCFKGMLSEMEKACDDTVLRHGVKPADYADDLLQIAVHESGHSYALQAIAVIRPSTLGKRVMRILRTDLNRQATGFGERAALFSALLLLLLPLAMLRGQPKSTAPPSNPNSERSSATDLETMAKLSSTLLSLEQAQLDFARASELFKDHVIPEAKYNEVKRQLELIKADLRNDTNARNSLILEAAKEDLERSQELFRDHVISEEKLREQQANFEMAKARTLGDQNAIRLVETRIALRKAEDDLKIATALFKDRVIPENKLNRAKFLVRTLESRLRAYTTGDDFELRMDGARRLIEQASDFYKRHLISDAEYKAIYSTIMPTLSEDVTGPRNPRESIDSLRGKLRRSEARFELLSNSWKQSLIHEESYHAAQQELETLRKKVKTAELNR